MDTSETYIKMCEKAKEIQKEWQSKVGDWFYKRDGIGFGLWLVCKIDKDNLFCSAERMNHPPFNGELVWFMAQENYIWLPRQDQLQEMLGMQPVDMIYHLVPPQSSERLMKHYQNYLLRSIEQLWLAFVMKEKHNKVWDGSDWIKGLLPVHVHSVSYTVTETK